MAATRPTLKKSVTIDPDVLEALIPERKANLSATVNDGLQLLAALDAQRELVQAWETEHGEFTDDELKPFLEAAMRAQVENVMRLMRESGPSKTPVGVRHKPSTAR
jgi:hypothetical protein